MAQRFRDLSVSTKVIAAFAFVLAATVVLGIFAVSRISVVNADSAEMRDDWVPGMRMMATFQYTTTRYRSFQHAFILGKGTAREADIKTLGSLKDAADEVLRQYEAVCSPGKERELLDRIHETWNAYTALQDQLAVVHSTKGLDESAPYLMGPMRKNFGNVKAAVDALIAYNNDGVTAAGNAAQQVFASARLWIYVAIALAMLLCFAAGYFLIAAVSKPLIKITGAMTELASGKADADIPYADQKDEIGKLADAMTSFKNQLSAAENSKAEQTHILVGSIGTGLEHLAKGDLTHRVTSNLTGPFAKLKEDFNIAMKQLQNTVAGVLSATAGIANGANEISTAAEDLSRRTEQQASSLEETAAALEEITASVKSAADNARGASGVIGETKAAAEEGGQVVESAIKAMDAIAQSSRQVTDIIGVIDEIAFQTNLLALNAGVEAARAGDAGRGFAVVASEVRALAQRSSEAAKQIKNLIKASGEHVGEGVKLVGESGQVLKRIIEQVVAIDGMARNSAEAGQQQSSGIEEVNAAVSSMDQATQQNAAMVEQSTAASRHLASETAHLQELVGFFDVGAAAPVQRPVPQPRVVLKPGVARPAGARIASSGRLATVAAVVPENDSWTEF